MVNDRGKRGGRAIARGGRTGARGRNSSQADSARGDNGAEGGRGVAPGGDRGGRGQIRRGGRGSRGQGQRQAETPNSARRGQVDTRADGRLRSPTRRVNNSDEAAVARAGEAKAGAVSTAVALRESQRAKREGGKRVAESDAITGTSGAAMAATASAAGSTGARRSPAKRAKVADAKVLWSPGKIAKDGTSLVAGGDGGEASNIDVNSDGSNSSHSAQKGRNLPSLAASFKERYGEDLRMDEDEVDGKGEEATLHATARHGTGGRAMTLAETALSMSPTKMASEVQKARARAREHRFGSASKSPAATLAKPPFSDNAGVVVPSLRLPAGTPSRPSGSAAIVQAVNGGKTAKSADASMPPLSRVVSIPVPTSPARATITSVDLSAEPATAGALATIPRCASDVISVAEWSVRPSGSITSVSSASPATMIPVVPPAVAEKKEKYVPGPPASAPAVGELVSLEGEDSPTTRAAAPKRPISDRGEVCVVQPPPKKIMSTKQRQGTSPGKMHTLRLRLRADVRGNTPERTFDGGVEESKGFEPPNSQPLTDGGVEECKGFDPPNLPPTPRRTTDASPVLPIPGGLPLDVTAGPAVPENPPTASATDSTSAASVAAPAVASLILPDVVRASGLPRQSSWGPSFGISGQAEDVPAVTTPGPVAPSSNPWVLSPNAPTFAKNRGRPLSQSFLQPTANVVTTVGIGGSAGGARMTTREKASCQDEATKPSRALGKSRIEKPSSAIDAQPTDGPGGGQQGRDVSLSDAGSHPLSAGQANIPLERQRDAAMGPVGVGRGAGDDVGVDEDGGAASTVEARSEEVALGVRVGGRALELLERLKLEREESLVFDRKLTQALLDL